MTICNVKAPDKVMPSPLILTTSVQSPRPHQCYVPAKGAKHKVSAWNSGLLPYWITVHGECETDKVRYNGTTESPEQIWETEFWVSGRPGFGRRGRNSRSKPLTSQGKGEEETIRADLTWAQAVWLPSPLITLRVDIRTV